MAEMKTILSAVEGVISGKILAGEMVLNDYRLIIEDIEGGHRLTAIRGSEVQSIDIMDGADGFAPTIDIKHNLVPDTANSGAQRFINSYDITIKDKNGSETITLQDGRTGAMGYAGTSSNVELKQQDDGVQITSTVTYGGAQPTVPTVTTAFVKNGKTPVKGVDYLTSEEVSEIIDVIAEQTMASVSDQFDSFAPVIDTSVVGDGVVSVSDSLERPPKGLILYGKTTQDGTPTPDEPKELAIAGNGGNITIIGSGVQLIQFSDVTFTASGVTWSFKDGTVKAVGTAIAFSSTIKKEGAYYDLPIIPGTYFMSGSGSKIKVNASITKADGTIYYRDNSFFTLDGTETQCRIYCQVAEGTKVDDVVYPMLNIGTTALPFEPYVSDVSLSISTPNGLPGIPVSSDGNYTDSDGQMWLCDEVDFARGVRVQNIGSIVLDGSNDEAWVNATYHFYINLASSGINKDRIPMLGSHHVYTTKGIYELAANEMRYGQNTVTNACFGNPGNALTLNKWKAKLAESPLTLVFALAEPVETALSEDELTAYAKLVMPKWTTLLRNDAGCGMIVDYAVDTKAYVASKANDHYEKMLRYVHMPRVLFNGDTSYMSKDNAVILQFEYRGAKNYINDASASGKREDAVIHKGYAKVKWQGSGSINFPKKNYTITLYSDPACTKKMPLTLRTNWGAQSKYCMKANFSDPSHCRNVIAARFWGECVMSRPQDSVSYAAMNALPNGGAIDGYPVLVSVNNRYTGLYTMNIPKDEWMFGMHDGEGKNTVLSGEDWNAATMFQSASAVDGTDWDYEVEPADKSWVVDSFNAIYNSLILGESTANEIAAKKAALESCLDIYSVIDYGIFIDKVGATDNMGKNQLMITYDGAHWIMGAYDLDTAFGMYWSGTKYLPATNVIIGNNLTSTVKRLYANIYDERKAVIDSLLTKAAICNEIYNFLIDVPQEAFDLEAKLWPDMAGANSNGVAQIINFVMLRD